MQLTINGEKREMQATHVGQLLEALKLLPSQVAVEHNGTVLFRQELDKANLQPGDKIEIVRVVAGG